MIEGTTIGWRRGFFRLWVLVSILWCLAITILAQPWDAVQDFDNAKKNLDRLPAAYAKIEADIALGGRKLDDGTFYSVERLAELKEKLKAKQAETELEVERFSEKAINFGAVLLGFPVLTFFLGAAISWVIAGFKRNSNGLK